ncbi:MAG TPA: polysaccharide biosynthesis/export family protein, partial [Gemmataceae bacterium]
MSRWMLPLIVILLTMLSLSAQEPVPTAIRPTSSPRVPIVGSSRCLGCDNSPSDAEVLRYLKPLPSVPNVCETTRDNIVIVKNRLVDKLDEPRFFPLVGPAQLHRCRWECVATYTETTQTFHPFPMKLNARKSEILYIDKDYLEVTRGNESVTVPLKCELAVSKESPCSEAAPAKVATRPAYIIEPPDNISITALLKNGRGTLDLPGQAISGLFLVRADGCVNLGVWGSVSVSGMTLDQAADAVRQVVLKGLNEPKMEPVKADQILV